MAKWDGNVCIKFASLFLDCKKTHVFATRHAQTLILTYVR
jgi:hypothetical protein